jgi:hypothetical protein
MRRTDIRYAARLRSDSPTLKNFNEFITNYATSGRVYPLVNANNNSVGSRYHSIKQTMCKQGDFTGRAPPFFSQRRLRIKRSLCCSFPVQFREARSLNLPLASPVFLSYARARYTTPAESRSRPDRSYGISFVFILPSYSYWSLHRDVGCKAATILYQFKTCKPKRKGCSPGCMPAFPFRMAILGKACRSRQLFRSNKISRAQHMVLISHKIICVRNNMLISHKMSRVRNMMSIYTK